MESKAFFEALQLNKHCTARLHREERHLDDQQKKMYSRVWREKELLMDDYIHINVRTPSPQRIVPSPGTPRSSSAAELLTRPTVPVLHGRKDSLSARTAQQSSVSSELQMSGVTHAAMLQSEPSSNGFAAFKSPHSVKMTSAPVVSSADQVDSGGHVQCVSFPDKDSDDTDPSLNWAVEAQLVVDSKHRQTQISAIHKRTSRSVKTDAKPLKYSPGKYENNFTIKTGAHKRSASAGQINSGLGGDQETHTCDVRSAAQEQIASVADGQNLHTPPSSRPLSSHCLRSTGSSRKLTSAAGYTQRKQELLLCQQATDKSTSSTWKERHRFQNKSVNKSQLATSSDSVSRISCVDVQESDLPDKMPHEKDERQTDSSEALNNARRSMPKCPTQTHDSSVIDHKVNQGIDKNKHEGAKAHLLTTGHYDGLNKSKHPPRKKVHVRQMTLDPKLVLPLSSKRYQCKKEATIIPVIAVQGQQATLYPNAEAKAGRVVKLERRVRGWIERSTSILFCLENIHSKPLQFTPSSSNETPHMSLQNDDYDMLSINMISSMTTLPPNSEIATPETREAMTLDKPTKDNHGQEAKLIKSSSSKALFKSRTLAPNSEDEDVVLVPQTIHKDPESPLFQGTQEKREKKPSRTQTMQRQQSLRTSPPGTRFVRFKRRQTIHPFQLN